MLELIAASLMVVPQPDEEMAKQVLRTYPREAVRRGASAAAVVAVRITPEGEVYRCDTLAAFGDEQLARQACEAFSDDDLRFDKPQAVDGSPSYSVYNTIIQFMLQNTRQGREVARATEAPDLSFEVASLPDDYGNQLEFEVGVQVSADGNVDACDGVKDAPADYVAFACDALAADGYSVLTDENDAPVSYVTRLDVRFALDKAA